MGAKLASLLPHFPDSLHMALLDSTRLHLKSYEEAYQQLTTSDISKMSFMSSKDSERRVMHTLKECCHLTTGNVNCLAVKVKQVSHLVVLLA